MYSHTYITSMNVLWNGSGTGRSCCICAGQMPSLRSLDGSTACNEVQSHIKDRNPSIYIQLQYNIHCLRLCQFNANTNQVLRRCNEAEYAWHVVHTRAEHKGVICRQDSTETLQENAPHILQRSEKHFSTAVTSHTHNDTDRQKMTAECKVSYYRVRLKK